MPSITLRLLSTRFLEGFGTYPIDIVHCGANLEGLFNLVYWRSTSLLTSVPLSLLVQSFVIPPPPLILSVAITLSLDCVTKSVMTISSVWLLQVFVPCAPDEDCEHMIQTTACD